MQSVTYSLLMELLFSSEFRTFAGCVSEGFWALGIMALAVMAKYVQHWRYIQLAINIPTVSTIFYIWIIPESVRWLLSRGKVHRAEKIVCRIASCNGVRVEGARVRQTLENLSRRHLHLTAGDFSGAGEKRYDIRDIFRQGRIRKHALVLFFIWFSISLSYYGISFSIPNLSGDRYLNFVIGGGIELAAYVLAFAVLQGFGRKIPLVVYLLLSGCLAVCVVTVKTVGAVHAAVSTSADPDRLVIGLALIGKAAVVSCFCTMFIYSRSGDLIQLTFHYQGSA